jgi:hypothetical protein
MAADDQPSGTDAAEEPEVLDANRRDFADGYMHGLTTLFDLLLEHGPYDYVAIYEHCAHHYDALVAWQKDAEDRDPPGLPPFVPNAT